MASKKSVFVILTSSTCGHCQTFKSKYRDEVIKRVKDDGKVNFVEINFPTSNSVPGPEYHPDLVKYIGWFPEFIIFTGESWENHSIELIGSIMAGKMVSGRPEFVQEESRLDVDSIISWINKEVPSGPFESSESLGGPYRVNTAHPTNVIQSSPQNSLSRYGVQPPRHPTINSDNKNPRKVVLLTEGGRPLNKESIPGEDTEQRSVSSPGFGSMGYVPTIGMRTKFRSGNIETDIK